MDERGKPVNMEELLKRHRPMIYGLALSISRNRSDSEDILQNVYLKIFKNIGNFEGRSQISTWIYKITYNEALMYLRRKYRQYRLYNKLAHPADKGASWLFVNWSKLPDEELLDREFKGRLERAIRNIPLKYRMPLLLHQVEGLPLQESSRILGLKVNSLKTRLHRAYKMVRSEIADYFKDRLQRQEGEEPQATCGIWENFIYDYAGNRLDQERRTAFSRHIEDCAGCRSFLDGYSQAIRITGALECRDLPPELKAKIDSFLDRTINN